MAWFRRRENEEEDSAVHDEAIREAEAELRRAERQLAVTEERSGEVARVSEVIENIGKRNHLGPSFFDALGIQRPRRKA